MNKISKGKAVGLLSLGLASVALGSVGFASWVVSGTTLPGSLENVDSYVKLIEVKQGETPITSSYSTSFDIVPTETETPVTYTFKFGWGKKFNFKNPVVIDSS